MSTTTLEHHQTEENHDDHSDHSEVDADAAEPKKKNIKTSKVNLILFPSVNNLMPRLLNLPCTVENGMENLKQLLNTRELRRIEVDDLNFVVYTAKTSNHDESEFNSTATQLLFKLGHQDKIYGQAIFTGPEQVYTQTKMKNKQEKVYEHTLPTSLSNDMISTMKDLIENIMKRQFNNKRKLVGPTRVRTADLYYGDYLSSLTDEDGNKLKFDLPKRKEMWKLLSEEEKRPYEQKHLEDMERYRRENEEWMKKHPKKPVFKSAYHYYQKRENAQENDKKWKDMDEAERKPYEQLSTASLPDFYEEVKRYEAYCESTGQPFDSKLKQKGQAVKKIKLPKVSKKESSKKTTKSGTGKRKKASSSSSEPVAKKKRQAKKPKKEKVVVEEEEDEEEDESDSDSDDADSEMSD